MENLKVLRNAKKKSRQLELQRQIQQESTINRLNSSLFDTNQNYCDPMEGVLSQQVSFQMKLF
ncbi:hypothetical protein BpHYR1_050933 [Brachionus plicatilis]|uniref:Uncharacterized protein n=1 Tax=Brachionus plicatilis TaxID=10195 RepID=A0A3M7QTS3_BRAPC|nr:hypothetical protein BpHYR1_050933 [Brachionus plicatilis]